MTNDQIISMMIEDLKKVSTPERKAQAAGNFPTSMEIFGIRMPDLKLIEKNWSGILSDFLVERWIELCLLLTKRGILECQILAYELIWKNKKVLKSLKAEQIIELSGTLDNWVSTDTYCTMIAGWHWREGTLSDKHILTWLKSENRWLRRTAVVCTIPLNLRAKGGTGDTERTLMVCKQVVTDRDDMVIKALSWALRELSKSDKQSVVNFMNKHWDQLHGRVKRDSED